jgi:NtrC-family two-component system sensor histidine kinase KinB
MTLKKKILIGYGVTFALMGLVIVWTVSNLVSLGKATDAILSENYRSIIAAENMVDALERQDSAILLIYLGDIARGISQFRENEAVFLDWLSVAKGNITVKGEAELVRSIDLDYAKYRQRFSAMTDLRDPAKRSSKEALAAYHDSVYPLYSAVREACVKLRRLNESTMYGASVKARQVAERTIWSTVIVAVAALLVALVFSLLLADRITRPLRQFMEASRKIGAGDYAVSVSVRTDDELGLLAEEFNRMTDQLHHYHEMNIEQIISEKNKGEAILSSIEDGLVVFDVNLKVTGINTAARKLLNLEFSDSSRLNCSDILADDRVCDLIRKTVATGELPYIPDEQRIINFQTGEQPRQCLFSVTVIRGKERKMSGIVLLIKDITRLKEVERLKSEFVMAASHELRTPLTSLGMSVDLLLEHVAPGLEEKDRELLQAAHDEVYRIKALVSDLLDLSKIESGKIDLDFESVPVHTLFDHVHAVFRSQLDMKEVYLTSELMANIPMVRADANKITWVLTNLISNALRYAAKGGHIELTAKEIGNQIHLSVRDDGPGIPVEYQSKIFQKFVQVAGRESGGAGLGLAICKEIVRAHGGTIWVESTVGQGSTFTFTLPVAV